jgi:hypothetical protein
MAKEFTKSDSSKVTVSACRECPALITKRRAAGTRYYCKQLDNVVDNRINAIDTDCPLPNKS